MANINPDSRSNEKTRLLFAGGASGEFERDTAYPIMSGGIFSILAGILGGCVLGYLFGHIAGLVGFVIFAVFGKLFGLIWGQRHRVRSRR